MMRWCEWRQVLAASAIFVVLAQCGCGGGSVASQLPFANADNGRSVAAVIGDEIDVTLQTIGPGQYADPTLSSDSLRFRDVALLTPPNPGGPQQLFRFAAVAEGVTTILIAHTGLNPTFQLSVTVHKP
jgi:hypothetical protein